jgi:hypothetical protein
MIRCIEDATLVAARVAALVAARVAAHAANAPVCAVP